MNAENCRHIGRVSGERGGALVLTLIAIAALFVFGMALVGGGNAEVRMARNTLLAYQALNAADSGLAQLQVDLTRDPEAYQSWGRDPENKYVREGVVEVDGLVLGRYTIKVQENGDQLNIEVTGTSGNARRVVDVMMRRDRVRIDNHALVSGDTLALPYSTEVNSGSVAVQGDLVAKTEVLLEGKRSLLRIAEPGVLHLTTTGSLVSVDVDGAIKRSDDAVRAVAEQKLLTASWKEEALNAVAVPSSDPSVPPKTARGLVNENNSRYGAYTVNVADLVKLSDEEKNYYFFKSNNLYVFADVNISGEIKSRGAIVTWGKAVITNDITLRGKSHPDDGLVIVALGGVEVEPDVKKVDALVFTPASMAIKFTGAKKEKKEKLPRVRGAWFARSFDIQKPGKKPEEPKGRGAPEGGGEHKEPGEDKKPPCAGEGNEGTLTLCLDRADAVQALNSVPGDLIARGYPDLAPPWNRLVNWTLVSWRETDQSAEREP